MTTQQCPACGEQILVVQSSRWGGTLEAFDPKPGHGEHYDTLLDAALTHVATAAAEKTRRLQGRVPLYREHRWTCAQGLKVPSRLTLPGLAGYTHKGG